MTQHSAAITAGIEELVRSCRHVAAAKYVTSHGGNLSLRIDADTVLITPTQVAKGDVKPEDICVIDMAGKVRFASPGRKPTGEWPFHVGILRQRPDLRGLVHAHPPAITGLAIAHSNLLGRPLLPEPVLEVGPVLPVKYAAPLSDALADAFTPVIHLSNAFLMLNHGILVGNALGVWRAVELLDMLEAAAQSAIIAQQLGVVKELTRQDVDELDQVLRTRGLPLPGSPKPGRRLADLYFPGT